MQSDEPRKTTLAKLVFHADEVHHLPPVRNSSADPIVLAVLKDGVWRSAALWFFSEGQPVFTRDEITYASKAEIMQQIADGKGWLEWEMLEPYKSLRRTTDET